HAGHPRQQRREVRLDRVQGSIRTRPKLRPAVLCEVDAQGHRPDAGFRQRTERTATADLADATDVPGGDLDRSRRRGYLLYNQGVRRIIRYRGQAALKKIQISVAFKCKLSYYWNQA